MLDQNLGALVAEKEHASRARQQATVKDVYNFAAADLAKLLEPWHGVLV